jgi:uncharacterized FlaG/YvyC family protein
MSRISNISVNTIMSAIDIKTSFAICSANIGTAASLKREPSDRKMELESTNDKVKLRETSASFSFYGSRNERVAIVIKDKATGKVLHEFPSKNIQELHVWLEKMGYKIVDEMV